MLLTLAGQDFEDYRMDKALWPEFKPKTPMGQLPLLEINGDGVFYCQSNSISRYLAKKFGFAGKTERDELRVDMIFESVEEAFAHCKAIRHAASDEEKAILKRKLEQEVAPKFLGNFEKILRENKGGNGWFAGDDITVADIQFYNWIEIPVKKLGLSVDLSKYEKLNGLRQRVESHPKIAEWIRERPTS